MQHRWAVTGILPLLLVLGACATIIEGTDQTVTVLTEPPNAVCTLSRDGSVVAVANPTPGTVSIEKSKDNISIVCEKDRYFNGAASLSSDFQAMTFGNIILGGVIGVVIDASSGVMNEYPESVTIVLVPKEFSNANERDAFFDRQRTRIEREAAEAAMELGQSCDENWQDCESLARAIDEARDAELREFERQREAARIGAVEGPGVQFRGAAQAFIVAVGRVGLVTGPDDVNG